jgi:hypothetical protein
MAQSPAHRFGQIVGEVLEAAIVPLLEKFADEHSLYLDRKGARACRTGLKCSWLDLNGNIHDLDFVLERGGTADKIGAPAAFIETAWRRYTKHSRNKVQEIQGAIEPLAETYRNSGPFKGAVLAGVFTQGALNQLKSLGFTVLYFPTESVVDVFRRFRIDASSTEDTPDHVFQRNVDAYERLSRKRKMKRASDLAEAHADQVSEFLTALSATVLRQVERIVVLALHGESQEMATIDDAIQFIESYDAASGVAKKVERFEIQVRYNNGNLIEGKFKDKAGAIEFLRSYQPVSPRVE